MPRKTRTTLEPSANHVLRTLDDIRLTVNDVKFGVRLMAVHQEAMLRTIERWVHHLEDQETKRIRDAADEANAKLNQLSSSGQRQGAPEASSDPERSRAIAGPSTPASSSGSIM
jgi:hypothetical protein